MIRTRFFAPLFAALGLVAAVACDRSPATSDQQAAKPEREVAASVGQQTTQTDSQAVATKVDAEEENRRGRECQENLSKIDGAKEQWALEFRKTNGTTVTMDNLLRPGGVAVGKGYLKQAPTCPSGGTYHLNTIGEAPICSIGESNKPYEPHVLP